MAESTMDGVRRVIAKTFAVDASLIDEATTADDVNGWDSLSHTFLIVAVEVHFQVRFDPYQVQQFTCVGDMAIEVERLRS